MVYSAGGIGSSLANPIELYSSQSTGPAHSQSTSTSMSQSQVHSSSPGLVHAGTGKRQRPVGSARPHRQWTVEETVHLVRLIKDNPAYQTSFLPGHSKSKLDANLKMKGNTMLRAISKEIFAEDEAKDPDQIRAKITGLVKKYNSELQAMSETGKGLLLSEMRDGHVKTQREILLKRVPWWDLMHEMMKDRASSDPDIVVTGAGEIDTQGGEAEDDEDMDESENGDSNDDDDDLAGLSQYSRARRLLGHEDNFDELDDDDASVARDSQSFQTPRIGNRSGSSLPGLERLAAQSSSDGMRASAVSAHDSNASSSRASSSARRGGIKTSRTHDKGKGRAKPSTSSIIDSAIEDLTQRSTEERAAIIAEREQTKRRKLDVRAQELELKSKQCERDMELQTARFTLLESRIDNILALLSTVNVKLDSVMSKLAGR
ncbi:hypothetical protein A4X03_0g7815 [Tilletia caries]|uniref:Uncharacterized protein n=4 Tax=Tilletia TaxID=13289 RepID=A0A177V6P7_9BASI|nr:hypothetical protein CF328_g8014 [Tilletia controversa]KAE8184857.1 hypothetical protein CF335_g7896 [Tilletia laevis]KAE8243270.1 hypothetical protein A4X03_0g7815 [Tilletia caries]